jgi:hypothetical protein
MPFLLVVPKSNNLQGFGVKTLRLVHLCISDAQFPKLRVVFGVPNGIVSDKMELPGGFLSVRERKGELGGVAEHDFAS